MFNSIKDDLDYCLSDTKQFWQKKLELPTLVSEQRNELWEDYQREGIEYIMKKYGRLPLKTRVKNKIVKIIWGYSQVAVFPVMLITPKGGWHNELETA